MAENAVLVSDSGSTPIRFYRRERLWQAPYRAIVYDTVWSEMRGEELEHYRAAELVEAKKGELVDVRA